MTLLKRTLFGVFMRFKVKKNTHFTDTVYYCCSAFLKRVDLYKVHCSEK